MSRPILLVARAADMLLIHPATDWSRTCERCGETVGIFPSGQKAIVDRAGNIEIVCDICARDLKIVR